MIFVLYSLSKSEKYLSFHRNGGPFPFNVQLYEIELNFTAQGGIYKAICIKNISNPKMIGHVRMGEFKSTR